MLVLKSSLDTGKEAQIATSVCQRFFPLMFQRPDGTPEEHPNNIYFKFQQLKADLETHRLQEQASDDCSFFDFYNQIEKQILFGITQTPQIQSAKAADLLPKKSTWKLPENHAACIKEIGMSMTRQQPTEWNEFMIVALGIPEDEPLPFLQPEAQTTQAAATQPANENNSTEATT